MATPPPFGTGNPPTPLGSKIAWTQDLLRALEARLRAATSEATDLTEADPVRTDADRQSLEDVLSAAVAEWLREGAGTPLQGGSAPVLGAGVVPEILRQNRAQTVGVEAVPPADASRVDERR